MDRRTVLTVISEMMARGYTWIAVRPSPEGARWYIQAVDRRDNKMTIATRSQWTDRANHA